MFLFGPMFAAILIGAIMLLSRHCRERAYLKRAQAREALEEAATAEAAVAIGAAAKGHIERKRMLINKTGAPM